MRVLMFDASDRGGIATYTDRLADALEAEGVDVCLSAPPGRARTAPPLRARFWGDETTPRAALYRARLAESVDGVATFVRAMRETRPDAVHLQTRIAPRADPVLLALARRRIPVIATVHDAEPLEGGTKTFKQRLATWRSCDAVVVHADAARDIVRRALPALRVFVLTYDIPIAERLPSRAEARAQLGIPTDRRVALMFGLLRAYKGLGLLADAWPRVGDALPDAWLYVVGAGGFDVPAVERLRAAPRCEVRQGFVPEGDVDAWLAAADVVVLPYTKGVYSAVLHRALSHGTPSIAAPGLAEQAEHFGAGPVVPIDARAWADALRAALSGSPLPAPRAPTGELTAAGTVAIYRELMAEHDRGH